MCWQPRKEAWGHVWNPGAVASGRIQCYHYSHASTPTPFFSLSIFLPSRAVGCMSRSSAKLQFPLPPPSQPVPLLSHDPVFCSEISLAWCSGFNSGHMTRGKSKWEVCLNLVSQSYSWTPRDQPTNHSSGDRLIRKDPSWFPVTLCFNFLASFMNILPSADVKAVEPPSG